MAKREVNETTQRVHELYNSGRVYKNSSLKMDEQITRCVNFIEGRQWTDEAGTEDYPKIVLNYLSMIKSVRQSNILQNDYSFLVNTMKFKDTKKIQYFLKYLYNNCKIKKKNLKVIKDNFIKGTSGLYFYWDNDARAILDDRAGTLKCEVIDIRNLVVADPSIQDIQDQEWLIYNIREKVGALKKQYPKKAKDIHSDAHDDRGTDTSQAGINEDEEMCNVYIHYFRNEEGQVCYSIHTKYLELCPPTFLNPDYEGSKKEQPNTTSANDEKKDKNFSKEVFGLYPFAIYVMDERDNNFYGLPGCYEYIEAQKSINAHVSTYDFAIQQNVLGGFIHKKGVFGDQEITTDNAQILEVDLLPNENINNVLARIPVNNVPSEALNYSSVLGGSLQQVSGATSVQMGQADFSNQTAQATEMLMQRAKENSSHYAIMFEEYMKDVAKVMFMFSKFFYKNKEFTIVEHGVTQESNVQFLNKPNPNNPTQGTSFNGEDYINEEMDFDIQVSPSNAFNESQIYQLAMMCVQTGSLDMQSVLKMLPYNTFPSFQELQKEVAKRDAMKQQLEQQQQQMEKMTQVMQQMSEAYQQAQKDLGTMATLTNENNRLQREMGEFQAESIKVANEATAQVNSITADMTKTLNVMNRQNTKQQETKKSQEPQEVEELAQ